MQELLRPVRRDCKLDRKLVMQYACRCCSSNMHIPGHGKQLRELVSSPSALLLQMKRAGGRLADADVEWKGSNMLSCAIAHVWLLHSSAHDSINECGMGFKQHSTLH